MNDTMRYEFPAATDRGTILSALDDVGCVVLQRAFDTEAISAIGRRAEARYKSLEHFLAKKEPFPAPKSFAYRPFNHAMATAAIYASDFIEDALPAPTLDEVFEASPVLPILKEALGGEVWLWRTACTVRKIYRGSLLDTKQELPLHCDGATAKIPELGDTLVICCVPLTPFTADTPRLEFFLPRAKQLLFPDPSATSAGSTYATLEVTEAQMRASYPTVSAWAPEAELGDTILFDKYTLHRTYAKPEMKRERISMDVRFLASGARRAMGHDLIQLA